MSLELLRGLLDVDLRKIVVELVIFIVLVRPSTC